MYPLSNVLGNSLTDNYGEAYHYEVVDGPFPSRVTSIGVCGDLEPERPMHLAYNDITDHYTTQNQPLINKEFSVDHPNLEEFVPSTALVWDCILCGLGKVEEGTGCTTSGCEGSRRPVKRRNTANKKERRRTQSINNAFTELRDCIPNVPADTKLSKIKTLRLATSYISHLSSILTSDDPLRTPPPFNADLSRRMTRGGGGNNGEDKRKEIMEIGESVPRTNMRMDSRRGKGRTGWPQTCWAMELQK
ncbi:heart- and neural crest derivatives-expressed protein 2 isoform X2 [Folsomia candida]|uniref:Heart-and neural crest derivatives-expressed protein 2 n=1 Tax=Folsomia candida TaxID=158441 RepID=A0A226E5Y8_FOLCA|nr:heart- and neural crest derivatives-expressed protein 2 isoform X2 [Folsomia candida]OXA52708.1 Heart- and neural crest derivatives-expressed protein 2 [Folsomia candida]